MNGQRFVINGKCFVTCFDKNVLSQMTNVFVTNDKHLVTSDNYVVPQITNILTQMLEVCLDAMTVRDSYTQ